MQSPKRKISLLAVLSFKYIDVDLIRGASFVAICATERLAYFAALTWGFPWAPALTRAAEASRVTMEIKPRMTNDEVEMRLKQN
jgi:hypothetical protein